MSVVLLMLAWLLLSPLGRIANSLSATAYPSILFSRSQVVIIPGSVILLYCDIDSTDTSLVVNWRRSGVPIVQDVPHIRLRNFSSFSSTTLRLIIDNFQNFDASTYDCTAQTRSATASSVSITLTDSIRQASEINLLRSMLIPEPIENRVGVERGDVVTITYDVEFTSREPPTPHWLLNGRPFRLPPSTMTVGGRIETTIGFEFMDSDVGVYQCIVTADSGSGPVQAYAIEPVRYDRGKPSLQPITHHIIGLQGGEELVLELATSGRFRFINWTRNEMPIHNSGAFSNFGEIYYIPSSSTNIDQGVYRAELVPFENSQQAPVTTVLLVINAAVADPRTTTLALKTSFFLREGLSQDLSCTSTGIPTPIITWTFNDRATQFRQTDSSVAWRFQTSGKATIFTAGTRNSTLHLRSLAFPRDNGQYKCIGANDVAPDGTIVTFQVTIVVLDIELTADRTVTGLGYTVILNCTVIRGNPTSFRYKFTQQSASIQLNEDESLNFLSLVLDTSDKFGSYRCEVSNGQATATDDITISRVNNVAPMIAARVEPSKELYEFGDRITVFCGIVRGDLPISITLILPDGQRMLRYKPVQTVLGQDSFGTYTCLAVNSEGEHRSMIQVLRPVVPVIEVPPVSTFFNLTCSRLFMFNCTARGLPRPIISWIWRANGTRIDINQTASHNRITFAIQQHPSSSMDTVTSLLTITNSPCAMFNVSCLASNRVGNNFSVAFVSAAPATLQTSTIIAIVSIILGFALVFGIGAVVYLALSKYRNFVFYKTYVEDDYSYHSGEDERASIYSRQHVLPVRMPSAEFGQPNNDEDGGSVQQTMSIVIDYCGKNI